VTQRVVLGNPETHQQLRAQVLAFPNEVMDISNSVSVALMSSNGLFILFLTGRAVRGDLAMTGEITLSGQVLPVAGIREKVLAAHRYGFASVILPQENERHVEEELGDDLPRAVAIDYVTRIDELLDLALRCASTAGDVAAVASTEPKSRPGGTSTSASTDRLFSGWTWVGSWSSRGAGAPDGTFG